MFDSGPLKNPTLKELSIGDRFYYPNKKDKKYKVYGKVEFNSRAGSPTRLCLCENTGKVESKLCRKEVVKF